ncbi:hypothetical protein AB0B25_30895 [Nocardia sp. NPDC049190]|uniref:hypothetical protein n=1 Tax=Nocardia sp. NPDC049190 TaxID=3155650 RepID=UPI00340BD025
MVNFDGSVPDGAWLRLVDDVSLLRPEKQVFKAMLAGFANQQLAQNLARTTAEGRAPGEGVHRLRQSLSRAVDVGDGRRMAWWTCGPCRI